MQQIWCSHLACGQNLSVNVQSLTFFSASFFSFDGGMFSMAGLINALSRRFSTEFEYKQVTCDSVERLEILAFCSEKSINYFINPKNICWVSKMFSPFTSSSYCSLKKTKQSSWVWRYRPWTRHWRELRSIWTGLTWTKNRCWNGLALKFLQVNMLTQLRADPYLSSEILGWL